MSYRTYAACVLAFLSGYLFRGSATPVEKVTVPQTVSLLNISDPGADVVRLTVYKGVIDGTGHRVSENVGDDVWRVGIGDRVVLFASRRVTRVSQ